MVSRRLTAAASRIAIEIGTSMSRRRPRRPSEGRAEERPGGEGDGGQGDRGRDPVHQVAGACRSAPDQTATDSSMTFIEAKPATPMRASRSRPSASVRVASSAALSSGRASKPRARERGDQPGLGAGGVLDGGGDALQRQVDAGGGDARARRAACARRRRCRRRSGSPGATARPGAAAPRGAAARRRRGSGAAAQAGQATRLGVGHRTTRMSRLWRKAVPSAAVAAISTRQLPGASGGGGGVAGRGRRRARGSRSSRAVVGRPTVDGERRRADGRAGASVRSRRSTPSAWASAAVQPSAAWAARARSKSWLAT